MSLIKINNENGISEITIDRPEALNAMNQEVVAEFSSVLQAALSDKETGIIILLVPGTRHLLQVQILRRCKK